ncbi:hypothetical protein BTR22_16370 [Alkalihalophilus pseudofirmus]|uniref:DUF72 domain-containing protein n=1 Tax=Alkalihalophilus pseudofirmus TaxID=79885 RepID=UPI000951F058|nr:hypothetical protein BTR22_16370 [Alkalihalophilus pseudofirmus]
MIYIGLAGWGDHDDLYEGTPSNQKLETYASFFPVVELDSSFYAVQPLRNMEKWARVTPSSFKFVVKAYQGMTGHQKSSDPFESREEMFAAFRASLEPLQKAGKLAMVLCQFPPWFDCKKEHVAYLRYVKEQLKDIPCALEFRNQTWFTPDMKERTLSFMKEENWIHSICDEPQAGVGSIPAVLQATNKEATLIRMHGRNRHGWNDPGNGKWRDVRYLYQYKEHELKEWQKNLSQLEKESKTIYMIFNNNSGGDAAGNAQEMISMLDIEYTGLAPRQLDLFSE